MIDCEKSHHPGLNIYWLFCYHSHRKCAELWVCVMLDVKSFYCLNGGFNVEIAVSRTTEVEIERRRTGSRRYRNKEDLLPN